MNYRNLAESILRLVGGESNVDQVTHCATRLRFNLRDSKKADVDALKSQEGVLGVVEKGGQFQVIIGNDVSNVYKELTSMGNFQSDTSGQQEKKKTGILNTVLDTISGTFTPFLPALTGAGMVKAVMALLVAFKLVDSSSQLYAIMNFVADAAFYFMPIMLAHSAAVKFRTNPYLAMTLGGILLHPKFIEMVDIAKQGGEAISLLGVPIPLVKYASSVIPIILSVWLMSYIYKFADRISPKIIKFFSVPLITLFITTPLMLIIVGPLGNYIGEVIAADITFLDTRASWLTPFVIGVLNPLLVMGGMHYAIIPFGVNNITTLGYDTLVGPGMLASNIAQGGAALAVAFKTRNSNLKQIASSAGVTAVCGITEPAMYGVAVKLKRPLYAVLIGGGLGGLFAGIFGVRRFMSGSPGLLTLPAYIGEPLSNFKFAVLTCIIAFVGAFVFTLILGFDDPKEEEKVEKTETKSRTVSKKITLQAPFSGQVIPLSEVEDSAFASGVLGKGCAIKPDNGQLVSPVNGTVLMVYNTGHAICLKTEEGAEVLIHVGMDTVRLEGKYFSVQVKEGQKISAGDVLINFDSEQISKEGYDLTTPVIIMNAGNDTRVILNHKGRIETNDELMTVETELILNS